MNHKEFMDGLADKFADNVDISEAKNSDYASDEDAFANFRACEVYGIDPKMAIVTRMSDKMIRIANLLKRQNKVADESIHDTLSDLANYSMILSLFIEDEAKLKSK